MKLSVLIFFVFSISSRPVLADEPCAPPNCQGPAVVPARLAQDVDQILLYQEVGNGGPAFHPTEPHFQVLEALAGIEESANGLACRPTRPSDIQIKIVSTGSAASSVSYPALDVGGTEVDPLGIVWSAFSAKYYNYLHGGCSLFVSSATFTRATECAQERAKEFFAGMDGDKLRSYLESAVSERLKNKFPNLSSDQLQALTSSPSMKAAIRDAVTLYKFLQKPAKDALDFLAKETASWSKEEKKRLVAEMGSLMESANAGNKASLDEVMAASLSSLSAPGTVLAGNHDDFVEFQTQMRQAMGVEGAFPKVETYGGKFVDQAKLHTSDGGLLYLSTATMDKDKLYALIWEQDLAQEFHDSEKQSTPQSPAAEPAQSGASSGSSSSNTSGAFWDLQFEQASHLYKDDFSDLKLLISIKSALGFFQLDQRAKLDLNAEEKLANGNLTIKAEAEGEAGVPPLPDLLSGFSAAKLLTGSAVGNLSVQEAIIGTYLQGLAKVDDKGWSVVASGGIHRGPAQIGADYVFVDQQRPTGFYLENSFQFVDKKGTNQGSLHVEYYLNTNNLTVIGDIRL